MAAKVRTALPCSTRIPFRPVRPRLRRKTRQTAPDQPRCLALAVQDIAGNPPDAA